MKPREIRNDIFWVGAIDWDRERFDALIPLPKGTSYNSYLVVGEEKTALIDTVEPQFFGVLEARLAELELETLDYVVVNHVEQDHSGSLPMLLDYFPDAEILCTKKAKPMLEEHLGLEDARINIMEDGNRIDLGGKSLRFIEFPWVHWPETMLTYCEEEKTLFPCDLFGSHLASGKLYHEDEHLMEEMSRLYFGQIMMPFKAMIKKKFEKIEALALDFICPSHGPLHNEPEKILALYKKWINDETENACVIPYVSMHESTRIMVEYLADALSAGGVHITLVNLETGDTGDLAGALVQASTLVVGTPTVLGGPHPLAGYAAILMNLLRPKTKFMGVIGSYGWGGKVVENLAALMPKFKPELLDPVLCKGLPDGECFDALDALAETIIEKHKALG